jgi:hypothetical protein
LSEKGKLGESRGRKTMGLKQQVCHDCQVAEDYLQNETAWNCFIQAVFVLLGAVKI